MSKLSIDIRPIPQNTSDEVNDAKAIFDLINFLQPRIAQAQQGKLSENTAEGIRQKIRQQAGL